MICKLKTVVLLLALALILTGCSSSLPKKHNEFAVEGEERVPEPTYKNGSVYEPFGEDTQYRIQFGGSEISCSFKLPDNKVFHGISGDNFTIIDYNSTATVSYGWLENLQDDARNRETLMDTAKFIVSDMDFLTIEMEIKEESQYTANGYTFQTVIAKASLDAKNEGRTPWVYVIGYPATSDIYLYWVVHDEAKQFEQYLHICENIMLSFTMEEV